MLNKVYMLLDAAGLDVYEVRLVLRLLGHMEQTGVCCESMGSMAAATGISKRRIASTLAALQQKNIVFLEESGARHGRANRYVVLPPEQWGGAPAAQGAGQLSTSGAPAAQGKSELSTSGAPAAQGKSELSTSGAPAAQGAGVGCAPAAHQKTAENLDSAATHNSARIYKLNNNIYINNINLINYYHYNVDVKNPNLTPWMVAAVAAYGFGQGEGLAIWQGFSRYHTGKEGLTGKQWLSWLQGRVRLQQNYKKRMAG